MLEEVVLAYQFYTKVKKGPYILIIADRSIVNFRNRIISVKTIVLLIEIKEHHGEYIQFNIIKISKHQIILGLLQIKKYNLTIDQNLETIDLAKYRYIINYKLSKYSKEISTIFKGEKGYLDQDL